MSADQKISEPVTLRTPRLLLRQWRAADRSAFAEMNADPRVMEFYPQPLQTCESDEMAQRLQARIESDGYGLWAVELCGEADFIGYIGLQMVPFEAHFTPALEVGWRLAQHSWGRGLATEGARAALTFAFDELGSSEVVAMTSVLNRRSQRVMEKLGMNRDPADDFAVERLPEGHPLRPHVLYRLGAPIVPQR